MSYISKNTGAFINARLTDKGRELLSIGLLNFTTFRLGDSEVDYRTLGQNYNIALQNVLRPKAHQPNIKTPLLPTSNALTPDVSIGDITPIEVTTITDNVEKGFFFNTTGTTEYSAFTSSDYVINTDLVIPISNMVGNTVVSIEQGTGFTSGYTEPNEGDLVLIKMNNPELTGFTQTHGVVDEDIPVPYLWYKIQSLSGTVSGNTLTVELDRELPDFSYSTVLDNLVQVIIYPKDVLLFDNGMYSGGTVWNMNNVWTYNMPGMDVSINEGFENYGSESFVGSKEYYGYTTEKQRIEQDEDLLDPEAERPTLLSFCEYVNSISVIHYSNFISCDNQPELLYGQKFYIDTDLGESPTVKIPTLMWHRTASSGTTIGTNFVVYGEEKFVTLSGSPTEISYYDLIESNDDSEEPYVVGRVFPDLQTITFDDQELVAAMSYKSNRNWTLPTLNFGTQTSPDGLFSQTQEVFITYMLESNSGYTTSLPNQNITCISFREEDCGPQSPRKDLNLTFPAGQLPYMNLGDGLGWYADRFKVLIQRVPVGQLPEPNQWRVIDLTNDINNHIVGERISPFDLENTTFTITNSMYSSAGIFNLSDSISIPEIGQTEILQFGDEQFFYGNVESSGVITKYRTQFEFTIPPNQWNVSQNPTYPNSGKNVHISEIGIYDNNGNLVAIGKYIVPIEKTNTTTIILEVALDF